MPNPEQDLINPAESLAVRIASSHWLWGGLASGAFFLAAPALPVGRELVVRYTSSHPIEYVETILFFVGIAAICSKWLQLRREYRALSVLPRLGPEAPIDELPDAVAALQQQVRSHSPVLRGSYWGRRLSNLLAFLRGRQTCDGLDSHLDYLSEAEADRLHSSHSLLQTVIWAIPILGFLGTVMGITLSIANLTPDQLDTSLNEVTGGLGVAFDTTALALTFSLVLGFASLFVKRSEEHLLAEINEHCRLEIHRCFAHIADAHPLRAAEELAAQSLLQSTSGMIDRQTQAWTESLDTYRLHWSETLEQQRQLLVETTQQGSLRTLEQHADQLATSREQLFAAQAEVVEKLFVQFEEFLQKRELGETALCASLERMTAQVAEAAERQIQLQNAQSEKLFAGFADRIGPWQEQLDRLVAALTAQSSSLLQQGEQLEKIVHQAGTLAQLQESLNQNLEAVRTAETFEETLHNLNAAVHLLTARVRPREAA